MVTGGYAEAVGASAAKVPRCVDHSGTKALPGNIRVPQDDGALKTIDIKGYRAPSVPGTMIVVDGNVCFSVTGSANFTDPAVIAELASCPAYDVIWGWAGKAGANAATGSGTNTAPAGPACSQMAKVTGTFMVAFKQEIGLWDGPMQSVKPRVTIHNGSSFAVHANFEGAARTSNPLHPASAVNGKWKSWPDSRKTLATGQTTTADILPANVNIPLVPKGRIEKFDVFAVGSTVASPSQSAKFSSHRETRSSDTLAIRADIATSFAGAGHDDFVRTIFSSAQTAWLG